MRWIFSDPHFYHKNIVSGITNWRNREGFDESQVRPFKTLEEMHHTIIDGINKYVKHDDELYCLGDWAFTGHTNAINIRNRINCNTIHLVYGNHDEQIINNPGKYKDTFASMQHYLEVNHRIHNKDYLFCLFHYSMRVWNRSHKGSYHLFGHSHGSLNYAIHGLSMDVGIDSAYQLFGEYRPFSFDEIHTMLSKRDVIILDHHKQSHYA